MKKILNFNFFCRDSKKIAQELLGKYLVRKIGRKTISDMIVEVEIYDGFNDKASHAFKKKGITKRNRVMFEKGGRWYVYLTYGMHWMLNIVTQKKGYPAAILIRSTLQFKGPGRVTKAFHINGTFNNKPAKYQTHLWIEDRGVKILKNQIGKRPRIGVDYAQEDKFKPLNYFIRGEESAKNQKTFLI
jgi:DNA-3-methyladenine glycosylase